MNTEKTGRFIAELRQEQGMNQTEFGDLFGVTNKTVSRWETGVYMPPVEVLEQMSKKLGVSINEIVAGERIKPEDFARIAEDNLKSALGESAFSFKEREKYFSERWERAHIWLRVFVGALVAAAMVHGMIKGRAWEVIAAMAAGCAAGVVLYNVKRGYVEGRVYGEGEGR